VAWKTGSFDGDVFQAREFEQHIDAGAEGFTLTSHVQPLVVDGQAEPGMSRRYSAELRHGKGCENHHRDIVPFAVSPEPIRCAVVEPGVGPAVTKADAKAQHSGLREPIRHFFFAR